MRRRARLPFLPGSGPAGDSRPRVAGRMQGIAELLPSRGRLCRSGLAAQLRPPARLPPDAHSSLPYKDMRRGCGTDLSGLAAGYSSCDEA